MSNCRSSSTTADDSKFLLLEDNQSNAELLSGNEFIAIYLIIHLIIDLLILLTQKTIIKG